jgi:RNA ligase (TIGR02306 family)
MMKTERKLATVRRIDSVGPIPGADAIEVATVGGWSVVIKKGGFKPGDLAVYCEIDSWIPEQVAPFLTQKGRPAAPVFEGISGNRLRTVTLRKQISQGLLLPLSVLPAGTSCNLGDEVTQALGIVKWEAPIPTELFGQVKGAFPSFVRKTDQERAQNLLDKIFGEWADLDFEVSRKMDGTSCTTYAYQGEGGVCGRNWEFHLTDDNKDNSLIRAAMDSMLFLTLEGLSRQGRDLAVQGELCGPGIQGNPHKLKRTQLFVFDIFDIGRQTYLSSTERLNLVESWITGPGLNPNLCSNVDIDGVRRPREFGSYANLQAWADEADGEGYVFKCLSDPSISFKIISNRYLLKEK